MENVRIVAGIILIAVGLFVYITATFGLFRFHYVLNRMHAAARHSFCAAGPDDSGRVQFSHAAAGTYYLLFVARKPCV